MFYVFTSLRKKKEVQELASQLGIGVIVNDADGITPLVGETNLKLFISGVLARGESINEEKAHFITEQLSLLGFMKETIPPITKKVQIVVKSVDSDGNPVYNRKGRQITKIKEEIIYHYTTDRLIFKLISSEENLFKVMI